MSLPPRDRMRIPRVTAPILMEVVEGACFSQQNGIDPAQAADYADVTEEYAYRGLENATQLGMLSRSGTRYYSTDEVSNLRRASKDQKPLFFRKFLQRFDPFILFVSLIGRGNSLDQAARKITVIYN